MEEFYFEVGSFQLAFRGTFISNTSVLKEFYIC